MPLKNPVLTEKLWKSRLKHICIECDFAQSAHAALFLFVFMPYSMYIIENNYYGSFAHGGCSVRQGRVLRRAWCRSVRLYSTAPAQEQGARLTTMRHRRLNFTKKIIFQISEKTNAKEEQSQILSCCDDDFRQ